MARRATALAKERAAGGDFLLLDSGSTLLGEQLANSTQGKVMVEAMDSLGYDAMVAASSDFSLGREVVLARAKEASFATISANVVDAATGQRLFPSHAIVERGERKIAIIGLTGLGDLPSGNDLGLRVLDPLTAAKDTVNQVRGQASVVLVLSHLGQDWDQRLASEVPGIAAVIGAGTYAPDKEAWVAPGTGTVVVHPGSQGEYLGVLRLRVNDEGRVVGSEWQARRLSGEYADDADMIELIARHSRQQ